ncbi:MULTISPECIES: hypothetical protein [unclassified Dysgonomonas]|uniref:hypothetical protein n=1 Tax=unclassified Dysgonomonas TaxID=2630389 RepID=UPI0013EC5C3C|nr:MULTISPECIES: hypothetical protein [unclassified Dysgonomonas]
MQTFKKAILTLLLILFVSIKVDAISVYALPSAEYSSISFTDNRYVFPAYEEKSQKAEVSMWDAAFRFTPKDYLLCILLLGVYVMLVRKKSNSRNADF